MNIVVCLKQTPDTETRVRISPDGRSIAQDDIQWVINPHDASAVEFALTTAAETGGEVTLLSLGPNRVDASIREALAMGAHKAVRLATDSLPEDPGVVASALATWLSEHPADLILAGRQSVDDDNGQVAVRMATQLGVACVTAVDRLEVSESGGTAHREVEGGHERVTFSLPAVVGVNRRLVEPRYPSFKGIMQAKKKTIEVEDASLGEARLTVRAVKAPPAKSQGKVFDQGVESVPDVVRLLREEAKLI